MADHGILSERQLELYAAHDRKVRRLGCYKSYRVHLGANVRYRETDTDVTLTEPGLDGVFHIPLKSAVFLSMLYIILQVVYTHGGNSYSLVTAKHFSNTYTDTKGHKVKRISILPRVPLAWVKMNTPPNTTVHHQTYPFTGDTVGRYQPEMLVSRIYASMNSHFHKTFVSSSYTLDSTARDILASELVSETLSTLGAPLVFKVLHKQSRLTMERLRFRDNQEILTIHNPNKALWGTCVLWQLDSDLHILSRATVNRRTCHQSPVRISGCT